MKISPKQYAKLLLDLVLESKDDKNLLAKQLKKFAMLLKKNRDLSKMRKIQVNFIHLFNKNKGIVDVKVLSFCEFSNSDKEFLLSCLSKVKNTKLEAMNVVFEVDKSLKGGFLVYWENEILDCSLNARLGNLRKMLFA